MVAKWTLRRIHAKHVHILQLIDCLIKTNIFPIETCDQLNFDLGGLYMLKYHHLLLFGRNMPTNWLEA
jgi:hypothetical protein